MSHTSIEITKKWIEEIVIGLNLCPFAKFPFHKDNIRYQYFEGDDLQKLGLCIQEELKLFQAQSSEELETTILVFPNALNQFLDYLEYGDIVNKLIADLNLEGEVQLATFHPNYQFAGTTATDVENYTNRSPFPMFHFLREASVEAAIEQHGNVEVIPLKNIETMKKIGTDEMGQKLAKIKTIR